MLTAFHNRDLRAFVAWTLCLTMVLPPEVFAEGGLFRLIGGQPETTAVTRLAKRIDHMERHLDQCGSIVIKTPDVWGESRLMRHRSDVESQLKARLDGFKFKINAAQATRDAAFLASAVALQEAISPGQVNPLTGTPAPATPTTNNVNSATGTLIPDPNGTNITLVPRGGFNTLVAKREGQTINEITIGIEPVIELDQLNRYLQHLNELRRLNEGDDNADTPGYALNLIRIPVSILPGRRTQDGFGAEVQITIDPYMSEEILPLAFKDFVIKGIVDRIGFDVFQIAQRADVNVLNQIVNPDQTSSPTPATEQDLIDESSAPPLRDMVDPVNYIQGETAGQPTAKPAQKSNAAVAQEKAAKANFYKSLRSKPANQLRAFSNALDAPNANVWEAATNAGVIDANQERDLKTKTNDPMQVIGLDGGTSIAEKKLLAEVRKQIKLALNPMLLGDVNHRDLSISASHRDNVDGVSLLVVALHVYDCLVSTGASPFPKSRDDNLVKPERRLDHGLTMPEVDTLLTRESEAAYEFLSQPAAAFLWTGYCTPELARKVREHRQSAATEIASVALARDDFFDQVKTVFPGAHGSVTEALAWQVIVESALINERLVQDMKVTAALKNCPCVPTDWMQFFGPDPCPEARMAFAEYVKCKWPIHVFALDPVTQDQNISDSFSQRREMQMALAIAASSRMLGGQAMSRFVRRMEYDLETIQLNRTAVGFSHGDNTFGWRFFPRIQAPPVPSNLQVITHDLLIGGQSRDSLARTYKLEPGIRECTALVVMPSFVPQVMVDVRTNWFRLAKHIPFYPFMKRKPDYEDSMDLSREVTELRQLQTLCVKDAHLYRDGEVYRLCKAVKRLEDRLPLQTHNVSVPWENDLGGFEVFQSGTQVLGPEIHGWYGAPGIKVLNTQLERNLLTAIAGIQQELNAISIRLIVAQANSATPEQLKELTDKKVELAGRLQTAQVAYTAAQNLQTSTAVYLVGKNFSVLNCRVIAGGVDVTETIQVINRNLMQVRIPSTVSTVSAGEQRSVVVHLATPYGATSRLLIPMEGSSDVADAAKALKAATGAETAANDAKLAAAAAKKTADESKAAVQKLTEEFPVAVMWGEKKAGEKAEEYAFEVQGHVEDNGFEKARFCPRKTARKNLTIHQAPNGTFEDEAEEVDGQLLLFVEMPKNVKRKVGPWDIKDGNFNKKDELTSGMLFARIYKEIEDELPCAFDPPVELVVTAYFKFKSDPLHVVKLQNTIKFKLTVIPKPKD